MLKLFCTAILAAVCLPALIAQTQANPSSDDTVVVGNPAQPVQWEHRGNIADAIRRAGPKGTVWIPLGYTGTDCQPISVCNPGSTLIVDLRAGGIGLQGTEGEIVITQGQAGLANPLNVPGPIIVPGVTAIQGVPALVCLGGPNFDQISFWTDGARDWPMFNDGTSSDCYTILYAKTQALGYFDGQLISWCAACNNGFGDFEPPTGTTITSAGIITPAITVNSLPGIARVATGTATSAGTVINAGTSQNLTVNVSGATTTDVAICSTNTAYPATWQTGIQVLPPVVTANTVTLTFSNPTAGNITPVAQAFRCTIPR